MALPEPEYFLCDVMGALPKGDLATLEHPVFTLATKPDRRVLDYAHNGVRVRVVPSVAGRATIHDKDVLIFCVSQLMAALNAGRPVGRVVRLTAHDFLEATRRETSGDAYRRLREALERLAGTRITTNIVTGEGAAAREVTTGFGLIESWQIVRRAPGRPGGQPGGQPGGRMLSVSVTLSDWLWRAVLARSVLTLSREYFGLRKPLERRIYELARKHCGRQEGWRVSTEVLWKKSGSASPRRVFRAMLRAMAEADALPDYRMAEAAGDVFLFAPRAGLVEAVVEAVLGPLGSETIAAARALAPGWDVYALEADWRGYWAASGRPRLRAPAAAFLGYVRARVAAQVAGAGGGRR